MNTFTIPEGTKEVKIDQIDNKVIIEFIPQVEKFEPKDGDIVYNIYYDSISIFKSESEVYAGLTIERNVYLNSTKWSTPDRFATDSEKQLLFAKLAEQGYKWNAEEKKIEKVRWRANKGESYWTFCGLNKVMEETEDNVWQDDDSYNNFVYFKNQEQAEKALEAVKNLLLNTEW